MTKAAATLDSNDYRHTFYGILNRQGQFWTPVTFDSKQGAEAYLAGFVSRNPDRFASMLGTHKVVPVHIKLTAIVD